jgi:membrane protease YdiL (CAAX protease family)
MILLDHLLLLILAVAHPVAGYVSFQRLLKRIRAGETVDRARLYDATIAGHWTLFGITLALWVGAGRDLQSLGLGLDVDGRFLAGSLLTLIGIAFLVLQLRQVTTATNEELGTVRRQLGNLEFIIPRNGGELARFYGLSLTAGIVEEVLWRGYMIWYLAHFMPLWYAAAASTLGFAIAHAYQGVANLPRITLVGAVFAGLYVLTGSLWLSMALHSAVDVLQGRTAYEVLRRYHPDAAGLGGERVSDA